VGRFLGFLGSLAFMYHMGEGVGYEKSCGNVCSCIDCLLGDAACWMLVLVVHMYYLWHASSSSFIMNTILHLFGSL
jgi:hypothetical protein